MSDLDLQQSCRRGNQQGQVRLIQEWLCLQGWHVKIDGDFGPATEAAVKEFQTQKQLPASGVVDGDTFNRLVAPMRAALTPLESTGKIAWPTCRGICPTTPTTASARDRRAKQRSLGATVYGRTRGGGVGVVCRVCLLLPAAGMPNPWGGATNDTLVLVRLAGRFREGERDVSTRAVCNGPHADHAR